MEIRQTLDSLKEEGNYRTLPEGREKEDPSLIDFSSNDYLGIAGDRELRERFFSSPENRAPAMTSSASRLLASDQKAYYELEEKLEALYRRKVLLFNSGYHANTGLIPILADRRTLIAADRLVHASIIDGIRLSGADFTRFRHNDCDHLEAILRRRAGDYERVLVVTESVFSMDGDQADITRLASLKARHPGTMLYVDEAHAFGVAGPRGLGLSFGSPAYNEVDVLVGTFGKAAASTGAFCVMSDELKSLAVNRSRPLIFSTALAPICCAWTSFVIDRIVGMDTEREHLARLAGRLSTTLETLSKAPVPVGHIQPLVIGDPRRAVELSKRLTKEGFKVLAIRAPAVPPGTERLRFGLSAAMTAGQIEDLCRTLKRIIV